MDFLRFILGSIFLGILGLFLYRYEQLNRFKFKIHDNIVYVIDLKHNRVIRSDPNGFKIMIKGNEDFLSDYFTVPNSPEESPLPQQVDSYSEQMPLDLPEPPTKAETAVEAFEAPVLPAPSVRHPITPPEEERSKTSSAMDTFVKTAADAAENAVTNAATDPQNYKRFLPSRPPHLHRDREENNETNQPS